MKPASAISEGACSSMAAANSQLVGGPIGGRDGRQRPGGDAEIARQREPVRRGIVRQHGADFISHRRVAAALDQRPHVAAAPGNQDDDRCALGPAAQAMTTPRAPLRTSPILKAGWPASRSIATARSASRAAT